MKSCTRRILILLSALFLLICILYGLYYAKVKKELSFSPVMLPLSAGGTSFTLSLELPQGWSAEEIDPRVPTSGVFAVESVLTYTRGYRFFCGGAYVGSLMCKQYEAEPDSPNWAIYAQLVYGTQYSWDTALFYKIISDNSAWCAATTEVSYSAAAARADGLGDQEIENYGVLAYSKAAPVYIAFEIDSSQLSERQLAAIAKSVSFLEVTQNWRPSV